MGTASGAAARPWGRGLLWRVGFRLFGERLEYWRDRLWRRYLDFGRARVWVATPVDAVFRLLEIKGLVPSPLVALEVFGRQGLWKTIEYAHRCDYLEFYEIHSAHADLARRVLPPDRSVIVAADSVAAVRNGTLRRSDYSFVLIDSFPQCFGDNYCECFDLFPHLFDRLADRSVLVINAFMTIPDGSDSDPRLLERRCEFYGLPDAESARRLDAKVLLEAHARLLPPGYSLADLFLVPHPGDTVFVVMCVRRDRPRTPGTGHGAGGQDPGSALGQGEHGAWRAGSVLRPRL